ncbi:MAG: peptide chain release factor N(5)-glutamine methyltransferase [Planctomycetota bacterium]
MAVAQTPSSATGNTASPSQQPDVWHVKRLLEWTTAFFERKQVDSPRLSAEMLLAHVLELQRIELYTNFDRPLSPGELKQYRELVQRAANQEPVRYLTGTAPFYGLDFKVSAAVLIPRPDTETLVETVLHHQKLATDDAALASPRIADLCTGSGCIAIALAKHLTEAQIVAVEIDEAAADVAKQNAADLGVEDRVDVRLGDLLKPLAGEPPFTIITANPPYIPSAAIDQLDRNVRDYEPRLALDGGDDGLDLHRRLLADTPRHLVEGGRLYVEMQFDQGPALLDLAKQSGHWSDVQILKDLAGRDRVLMARR